MWKVINSDIFNHVIPLDDIKEHIESIDCHCDPASEKQDNGIIVVIHHSYDGREWVEQANEIINKQTEK